MKTKQRKSIVATAKSSPDPDLRLQIKRRAYEIWVAGCGRRGKDIVHWLQAESGVMARQETNSGLASANI